MKLIFNTFEVSLLQFALRVIGNRELAQDAVQETFFRLYQRRSELNAREEARPRSWLWRCLRNLCMDHHRFASRTVAREFTDLEHDLPDQLIEFSDAEEILIDQSDRSRVLSAFENKNAHSQGQTELDGRTEMNQETENRNFSRLKSKLTEPAFQLGQESRWQALRHRLPEEGRTRKSFWNSARLRTALMSASVATLAVTWAVVNSNRINTVPLGELHSVDRELVMRSDGAMDVLNVSDEDEPILMSELASEAVPAVSDQDLELLKDWDVVEEEQGDA